MRGSYLPWASELRSRLTRPPAVISRRVKTASGSPTRRPFPICNCSRASSRGPATQGVIVASGLAAPKGRRGCCGIDSTPVKEFLKA